MDLQKNYLKLRLLALLLLITPGLAISSCIDPIVKQERKTGSFTGVKVGGAFDVVIRQTGKHRVVVEAEQDVIDKVRTEVKSGVLHVEMVRDWSWGNNDEVTVYIELADLELLHVSGAGDVEAVTSINADDLEIKVSGAGDLDMEVKAKVMDVTISGAGDMKISGTTDRQKVKLSGAGDYHGQELKSRHTYAKASGAGTARVYASQELEAYASGAGSIKYYGDPEKQQTNSSGAGSISSR